MKASSPGWAATLALVMLSMIVTGFLTLAASLALGYTLWGSHTSAANTGTQGAGARHQPSEDAWVSTAGTISPSTVSIQMSTGTTSGEGTGVVYNREGLILTNAHVVSGADTLVVTLMDGRNFNASLVGEDTSTDIALIRIDNAPDDLVPATFADSSQLVVGQDVMAVGTPLGLANTATTGIVSALNRPVVTTREGATDPSQASFTSAIQTDASINPGNSGGPLVNRAGEVVGINSSIASNATSASSAGSIGLGFAIPANTAVHIAQQLEATGSATHPLLGVTARDGLAQGPHAAYRGAEVTSVTAGSAAEDADIREGDIITAVNGVDVGSAAALTAYIRSLHVGQDIQVVLYRNGQALTLDAVLKAR